MWDVEVANGKGDGSGLGPLLLPQDTSGRSRGPRSDNKGSDLLSSRDSTMPDRVRLVGHAAVWEGDLTVCAGIFPYDRYRHGRGTRYAR
jgi:hypothetical protein